MKKTTIIMIAVAVTVLIFIEAFIIFATSEMKSYRFIEIETSRNMTSIKLNDFSKLIITQNPQIDIHTNDNGAFLICSTDSISSPQIIFPNELTDIISFVQIEDSLTISFRGETNPDNPPMVIKLTAPIRILTPTLPSLIRNEIDVTLALKGTSRDTIHIDNRGSLALLDAELSRLTLSADLDEDDSETAHIRLLHTAIDSLTFADYCHSILLMGDSSSILRNVKVHGMNSYNQIFKSNNLDIRKFSFIPAESESTITFTTDNPLMIDF